MKPVSMTPSCLLAAILFGVVLSALSVPPRNFSSGAELLPAALGEVLVAGGNNGGQGHQLQSAEILGGGFLPPLPVAVQGNSLSSVGSSVYSCGGYDGNSDISDCNSLDLSSASWKSLSWGLPARMAYHATIVVGTDIWISYTGSSLYVLDTKSGLYKQYTVPFTLSSSGNCMASDLQHRYAVGVGLNKDEIWVNKQPSQPESWSKVRKMPAGRQYFGCYLSGEELFITGGQGTETSCLILNTTSTPLFKECGDLETGRYGHAMYMEGSEPAVVGGYSPAPSKAYLQSVEVYHSQLDQWTTDTSTTLSTPRSFFGLTQRV